MARGSNSNSRYPNKRPGNKVEMKFSCGNSTTSQLREFEKVLNQINQHRAADDQVMIAGSLKVLLEHLENGEVHYMTEMSVPSSFENKPAEVVTTLKTFLKGVEKTWIIYHKAAKPYVWEAACNSVKNTFMPFHIYSCDNVMLLS